MKKFRQLGALEQRLIFLCAFLLVAFVALFFKLPAQIAAMENERAYENDVYEFSQLFAEIFAEIKNNYVEEVDNEELFQGAIRGVYQQLDPHSQWLPPRDLRELEKTTEGEFSGVGLHVTVRDGILTVIAPIPGSPAAAEGVRAMDRIVEIEGESTEGWTLNEAVERLTGETGTSVTFKVFRAGAPDLIEVTVKREKIKIENVFHSVLDGEIGYIRIATFADDTADDVRDALEELGDNEDVKALIVDLRYDTGGLLNRAIEICDFFLPRNQLIVSTKGRRPDSNERYLALQPAMTELPLAVLVNSSSASASEIFAGAMQDTERGFIIGPEGQTTFGKGSVQTISRLRHSLSRSETGEKMYSAHRLTTAKYYTPSGRTIHEIGITPDHYVSALTPDQEQELLIHGLLGDPDQTALYEDEPAGDEEPSEAFVDIQLDETIDFVKVMVQIQKRMERF